MLKYKEMYDYVLGILYTLKRKKQYGYFSLNDIISHLDTISKHSEIYKIAKYLEAEGYVKTSTSPGDVFVEITPSGIIYIEEKDENFMSSFESFLEKQELKQQIEKIASKISNTKIKESRKPIIDKINQIQKYLNSHKILKKFDVYTDVKILKFELQKKNPDKEVISIKLSNMGEISELKNQSSELKEYLYGFIETYWICNATNP